MVVGVIIYLISFPFTKEHNGNIIVTRQSAKNNTATSTPPFWKFVRNRISAPTNAQATAKRKAYFM